MRRFGIGSAILAALLVFGIAAGAYSVGYNHGLDVNGTVDVVRYGGWHPGWGFFPFGLILFPLFFFAIFALIRGAFWRGGWHDHDHHGPWGSGSGMTGRPGARDAFEDWHRRQHEPAQGEGDSAGDEPSAT
jgi:hypothetical protein